MATSISTSLASNAAGGRAARLAAVLAGLMMALPFLLPVHRLPMPSFESEWLAAVFGMLCLLTLSFERKGEAWRVPAICLAPLLLGLVLLSQTLAGVPAHPANAATWCAYLAFGAALAVAGCRLARVMGTDCLYRLLATALVAGGLLNAIAGMFQRWGPPDTLAVLLYPLSAPNEGVYGNVAQQNHYAAQLALAIGACVHLIVQRAMPGRVFIGLVLVLSMALALSGSRSGFLYLACIALVFMGTAGARAFRGRRVLVCALGIGAAVTILAFVLAARAGLLDPRLARLVAYGEGLSPRLFYWRHAVRMWLAHPWSGVGVDRFAEGLLDGMRPGETLYPVDQYAHDLPLQLLATTGLIGLASVALPLGAFLRRSWPARATPAHLTAWTTLAVLCVHSMLEQPLHYAYFLAILAFFLGTLDPLTYAVPASIPQWASRGACGLALCGCIALAIDYHQLAEEFYGEHSETAFDARHTDLARRLHRDPFFQPLTELIAPWAFVSGDAAPAARLAFNTCLLAHSPIADVVYRQALLLAQVGRTSEAMARFRQAALAYPQQAVFHEQGLAALSEQDPASFRTLYLYAHTIVGSASVP
jgi:O-antigen ligase